MKNYLSRRKDNEFGFNFFEDAFNDFFKPVIFDRKFESMKTDVKETSNGYELSVDMPGFEKKDINVSLQDGYLTVVAERAESEEDKSYIRRERNYSCQRSYYVGEGVTEEDVKAKYNNGTLILSVPKKEQKEISSRHIEID